MKGKIGWVWAGEGTIVFSVTGGAKGKCLFLCTSTGNVFVYHVSVELEEAKSFWLQGWIIFFLIIFFA